MIRNVRKRFGEKQRKAKQIDRMLVNLVQSICVGVGILLLIKLLSFPSPSVNIICIAGCVCCFLGFYEPRKVIKEFKQWKKWMNRCQVLFDKVAAAVPDIKQSFQRVNNQPTTRMLKRKMKKFNLSLFKN